jgi:hypothetical protein
MEKKKENIQFSPILHILFVVCGTGLMISGAVLIALKLFGFPFLFEGVMAFFMGGISLYVAKFQLALDIIVEKFTEMIEAMDKKVTSPHPTFGGYFGTPNAMKVEIDEHTSPEKIAELKKNFPFMGGILDAMSQSFKKDFGSMTIAELEKELKQAIEADEYEKAAVLKDAINKKKQL